MTAELKSNPQSEFPSERTEITLPGPVGELETVVDLPESERAWPATVVICHPHPQHGGTMHNKVVTIIERAMRELGLTTVRFNFRGVGESEGEFDDGYGETEDLFAVIEWVRKTRPDDKLWLAGFSFGSYIALRAAQNFDLQQMITIAPPVERYEMAEISPPDCPWLVVQGDEDDVVNPQAVYDWVELQEPSPELIVMKETGHFFHRRLMDLRGLLKNGVRRQLPQTDEHDE